MKKGTHWKHVTQKDIDGIKIVYEMNHNNSARTARIVGRGIATVNYIVNSGFNLAGYKKIVTAYLLTRIKPVAPTATLLVGQEQKLVSVIKTREEVLLKSSLDILDKALDGFRNAMVEYAMTTAKGKVALLEKQLDEKERELTKLKELAKASNWLENLKKKFEGQF